MNDDIFFKTKVKMRLERWLSTQENFPDQARDCIENFVLSCDSVGENECCNFINIDIVDFPIPIQNKLVTGFFYAYGGPSYLEYLHDGRDFVRAYKN